MNIVGAIAITALIISLHIVAYVTYKRTEKNTATMTNLALNR